MIKLNGQKIDISFFPDGTSALRAVIPDVNKAEITWCFDSESEMVTLFYLVNHIRNSGITDVLLNMPYIPNARMDRVKNPDEVFTLKYFSSFINSLNFDRVNVYDPHSEVSCALIDHISICGHISFIKDVMKEILFDSEKDILYYPDAGCAKKYETTMNMPFLKGEKKRDWRTGKIQGLEIKGDIPERPFRVLMIDDICSKGGTFYYSAEKLREKGASEIYLYITHCENTILEGDLIKSGLVNKIFTTDSVFTEQHPLINIIKKFR